MTPYFQIAHSITDDSSPEIADTILETVTLTLHELGLEMQIIEKISFNDLRLWNINVPGINEVNEKSWQGAIVKVCQEYNCVYRFRFTMYANSKKQNNI